MKSVAVLFLCIFSIVASASIVDSSQRVSVHSIETLLGRPMASWEGAIGLSAIFHRGSLVVKVAMLYRPPFSNGRILVSRFSRAEKILEDQGFKRTSIPPASHLDDLCFVEISDSSIVSAATVCMSNTKMDKKLCIGDELDLCVGFADNPAFLSGK